MGHPTDTAGPSNRNSSNINLSKPTIKKRTKKRRPKKSRIPPINQSAPIAPPCPADLKPPTISTISIEFPTGRDTGCGFVPKRSYLESKLTAEVEQYEDKTHRNALTKAENAVKEMLKSKISELKIKEMKIWTTGSLPQGMEIFSSDLDISVTVPEWKLTRMQQLHLLMDECCRRSQEIKLVKIQNGRIPVLKLMHKKTGAEIDITVENDDAKRNTQLLVWYGQIDARFPVLCKAVKGWAKSVGVEGAWNARLNSFTLCLMVIHYLQCGVFPAILPCLQDLFPELNGKIEVADDDYQTRNLREQLEERGHQFEENESTVGVLFAGFLKYYAEFDFEKYWISVRRGKAIEKRWNEEKEPMDGMPKCSCFIVVEDPFIEPAWNCGGSVFFKLGFERLRQEFQLSFDRLVKHNSIFGGSLTSVSRMKLDAAGKERDLQFEVWREEIKEKRIMDARNDDLPWGEGTLDEGEEGTWGNPWKVPFENNKHPSHYWDLKEKETDLLPWPEKPMRIRYP